MEYLVSFKIVRQSQVGKIQLLTHAYNKGETYHRNLCNHCPVIKEQMHVQKRL